MRWQDLKDIFRNQGFLPLHVEILSDPMTGRLKGCGLVRVKNKETADKAIKAINGLVIDGRPMNVRLDKFLHY